MTGSAGEQPGGSPELTAALRQALPGVLPRWLAPRRWFADKGRAITRVEIADIRAFPVAARWVVLAIADVHFGDGGVARYVLPLAEGAGEAQPIVRIEHGGRSVDVVDATEGPVFGAWLLAQFSGEHPSSAGRWGFTADPTAADLVARARGLPAEAMGAEQSNTSLRFGDALIAKLIRRLQPGLNPDEEMLRALSAAGFPHVPRYAGGAFWRDGDGTAYPVMLVQAFVANEGDGWSWMLRRLEGIASGTADWHADDMAVERLLGTRTAEMHVALSGVTDAEFAPVKPDATTIAADVERVRGAAARARALLAEHEGDLPDAVRARLPEIGRALRDVTEEASGFGAEADTRRIRVHGDYHLGQTLRTPEGDWTIVDFEGEPARPVAERREKLSALKDVAGMLRSFGYARGVAERATRSPQAGERLRRWEAAAREAFVDGYRDAIGESSVPLVPEDEADFRCALAVWEVDKALYEIAYEARNRPGWIALPLRALLPEADD